jgi:predicted dehydrogenase
MSRWERFCIVGVGGHARTKLIPAIEANGQTIAALVSGKLPENLPCSSVFRSLNDALANLDRDVAIVIASPPSAHFDQAAAAIDAGFDVIVEKPAFLTVKEASDVIARCAVSGSILVEAFMQRHTSLYSRIIDYCASNHVVALDVAFLIPSMPPGTFRSGTEVGASGLYDIGCYVLALLDDLGLEMSGLDIVGVRNAGTMTELLELNGTLGGIEVNARIGVGPYYQNSVSVRLDSGSVTNFHPLFYGRQGIKAIGDTAIEDGNAFEAMFKVPRERWLDNQQARFKSINAVTGKLELLAKQLAALRTAAEECI